MIRYVKSKVFTYLIMIPLNFEPYWSKISKRRIFKKNTIELNVGNPPWFIQTLSWRWDTSCEECYRQAFFTHFVGVTLCWGELTTHDWWMILLDYFWHGRKMSAWTILIHFNLEKYVLLDFIKDLFYIFILFFIDFVVSKAKATYPHQWLTI